ncbi:MAG: MlaD family protein [Syntrophobacterales bacterium]|nr:MlaD family protein [Syntrophobacterales bacterium]
MPRKVNAFYVGLFLIVTISITTGIVFWVGFSQLFEKKRLYVSYFAESVKGLQRDATVNYLGVPVGKVKKVGIAPNGRLVEVVLSISEDFVVDDTLVVRLREQGITGLRFLEIDKAPPDTDKLTPVISFTPPYPLIRSYPSEMQAIKDALERLYGKIVSIDFESIARNWADVALSVKQLVSSQDIENSIKSVTISTKNIEEFSENLRQSFKREPPERILQSANDFFKEAKLLTSSLNSKIEAFDWNSINKSLINMNSNIEMLQKTLISLDQNLSTTLVETQKTLRELQTTMERIRKEPGRLILSPTDEDPFKK